MRMQKTVVVSGVLALASLGVLAVPVGMLTAQSVNYGDTGNYGSVNQAEQADPPSQVARVSVVLGDVSVQPAGGEFNSAEINYPMTTGDRLYADAGSNAELQTGLLALRMGQRTDLSVTSLTDALEQFGLAQGSLHLRSYSLDPSQVVELDTPNIAVTVLAAGDVRVDVDPNSGVTVVNVLSGQVQIDGNGVEQVLEAGERAKFGGSNPVYAQWLGGARLDGLDRFAVDRDGQYLASVQGQQGDVDGDTIGVSDLSGNGDWQDDAEYGNVWFPTSVAANWQPYTCGHWTYVSPWGWTWVECESWGFAPFHYGRWNNFGGRWGWIPGPRGIHHPVYSPGQVVFIAGGPVLPGRGAVTAWIPLGPREVYRPWYPTSGRYVNRVNVTNIYTQNTADVRRIYEQRKTVSIYANAGATGGPGGGGFVNRNVATVVVPQESFAKGQRVEGVRLRVDGRQLAGAPVLARPQATPDRQAMGRVSAPNPQGSGAQRPVVSAVPPRMQMPVLATRTEVRGQRGPGNAGSQGAIPGNVQGNAPVVGARSGGSVYSGGNAPVERQQPPARNGSAPSGQGGSRTNVQGTGTGYGQGSYGQGNDQAVRPNGDTVRQPIAPNTPIAGGPHRSETPAESTAPRAVQPPAVTPIAPNTPISGGPRRPEVETQQRPLYDRHNGQGQGTQAGGQPGAQTDQNARQNQQQVAQPQTVTPPQREQQRVQPTPVFQQPQPAVQPQQPRVQTEQPRVQTQPRVSEPARSAPASAPAPSAPKADSTTPKK